MNVGALTAGLTCPTVRAGRVRHLPLEDAGRFPGGAGRHRAVVRPATRAKGLEWRRPPGPPMERPAAWGMRTHWTPSPTMWLVLDEKVVVRIRIVRAEIWRVGLDVDPPVSRGELHDAEISAPALGEHLIVGQYLNDGRAVRAHTQ